MKPLSNQDMRDSSYAKQCKGKLRYDKKSYAKLVIRRVTGRSSGMHAYRCAWCGFFHIGHKR